MFQKRGIFMPVNRDRNVQITVVLSQKMYEDVAAWAKVKHKTVSDVVRDFIKKGLSVEHYQENIDFLSGIIRQEVKAEMGKQANRLAAMLFKIGVLTAGNYFMAVRLMSDVISPSMQEDFKDINSNARKLGIDYMKQNGVGVVDFLEDADEVEEAARKLKTDFSDI
jgi:hypothetical protein